ncbi:mechanosensitive ion channel family protein [bacterium]|nr:mechanosensitive ion channel family protein [bacterium]
MNVSLHHTGVRHWSRAVHRLRRVIATGLVLLAAWPGVALVAEAQSSLGQESALAIRQSLLGAWKATVGQEELSLLFNVDGTYRTARQQGTFTLVEGELTLAAPPATPTTYTVDLQSNALVLSGGDLKQPLTFARDVAAQRPVLSYARSLFELSPGVAKQKLLRTLVILGIILASMLLIGALERLSRFLIYSDRGILKYIFQRHRSRTRTIHSVVLNVVKYFIVFSALGQILAELGVNYTTYIASLSVIGLAIGFGSQGLVQDVVTGLFLILDNQFDVGDMVEISAQTGVVTELGLRTTRLRNYLGQTVVIPNRNIASVGNYRRGALKTVIDVAARDAEQAAAMATQLQEISGELARQFQGTILVPPGPPAVMALQTGEHFVRVVFDLWPQQQALVDSQIVPRLRELLTARKLEIPNNRVAVFYRVPEQPVSASRGKDGGWMRRPS